MLDQTFDYIGGYWYEPGYCFRDALRMFYGEHHPISYDCTNDMTPDQVRAFCAKHGLELLTAGDVDMRGRLGIYIYRTGDTTVHAVFCEDVRRVTAAGLDIVAIILLED